MFYICIIYICSGAVKPEHTNFPRACYGNETTGAQHASGSFVRLRSKIYSNTSDIELNSNSSFKIKKAGLLRLSFNLWIHGNANSRPWINVIRYRGSGSVVVGDVINDNSSGYVSLSLSNFVIPVQVNDVIAIVCNTNGNEIYLDGNSGRANSQVLLELI